MGVHITSAEWKREHYKNDTGYREKELKRCREKYRNNPAYRERQKASKRLQWPERYQRRKDDSERTRQEILKHFPSPIVCSICGDADSIAKAGVSFHEKNGKSHPYDERKWQYILDHLDNFIPLCRKCHAKIHRFGTEIHKHNS